MVITMALGISTKHFFSLNQWLMVAAIFFSLMSASYGAQIHSTTDRNPVALNESFQIIFSTTETPDGDPDFRPLKDDFDILNQQQSTQSSWINGQSSKSIKWVLTVMAKRTGTIEIPSIHFGDEISVPFTITVQDQIKPQANTSSKTDALFLEVEISSDKAYVQEQLIYTVYFFRRIQLAQANLAEPEIDDAVVEFISENSYKTQIKGQYYLVTERNYAIFPQQSGQLTISPSTLTAQVVVDNNDPFSRFDSFFSLQNTQTKRITSNAVTVDVKPVPDTISQQHWLPAKQVTIQDSWSHDYHPITVGEPVTRTITLQAVGTMSSQLPALPIKAPSSQLKGYPDQVVDSNEKNPSGIIATRQQKIAYIPSAAGTYTLPAIEIPWFNVKTQQAEIARLPAVTLTAINDVNKKQAPNPPVTTILDNPPKEVNTAGEETTTPQENPPSQSQSNLWQGLTLLFAILWLLTLGYLIKNRQKTENTENINQDNKDNERKLKKACSNNDAQACQQAFNKWAKSYYHTENLSAVKELCLPALRQELAKLQATLYSDKTTSWDSDAFYQAFLENKKVRSEHNKNDSELEPLHRI